MKRYHVISIAVLTGLIMGLTASYAHAGEHRDRALCIGPNDTISLYDNGIVYASNSDYALLKLDMGKEHPEISNARDWAVSVMTDNPEWRCKVLR
ncbi:hypothetical protein JNE51_004432 [Salmonella enterica]|nr:hypothetical protein [Salmonella enterica]